ncbi:MAG: ExbD/TolR family protein [Luteimonas sp.]
MAVAMAQPGQESIAQMNITPLVDVMLVLLVIFMIAAPAVTQRIPLDLPGQARTAPPPERQSIDLRIDASGQVSWNGNEVPASALRNMMEAEVARDPDNQPTLRIDAAGDADYGVVAKILAAARNAGMERIGFLKQ